MTLSVINEFSGVLSLSGLGGVTVLGGAWVCAYYCMVYV